MPVYAPDCMIYCITKPYHGVKQERDKRWEGGAAALGAEKQGVKD